MSLPVVFRRAAQAEFDDAVDWYEQQRPGLGADLAARVRSILVQISDQPESHAMTLHGVRRAIVPKFPYHVIYKVEPGRIVVIAVFHGSRDPRTWQSRT